MQTNTDLTLYSRSIVSGAEKWTRSVIMNVLWVNTKAANVKESGLIDANSVEVYIPTHERATSPTIKPGDVITEGIVTKTISTSYTITDLRKEFSDVVTVRSVDRYDFGSPQLHHIMVGAS